MSIVPERTLGNLPASLTSFVGREAEMGEILALLTGGARLLTLTGAGGVGKTRLALEAAARLAQEGGFADGVWLVELAGLSDARRLAQQVAAVLRLQEEPSRGFEEVLLDALRSRNLLLVLDNCEHLIDACATLVHTILRTCPGVRILATSREPLGIAGETTRRVPSLARPDPTALPSLERLAEFPAVRLFADRGGAASADFRLTRDNAGAVAQVCDRLDGIPLALELAAARVRALSVEQIASRLDDRFALLTGGSRTAPPRQQTLEAAVAWSYDLLHEDERRLLRRLAVFVGGWSLEDAEAVCADGDAVLDPLTRLVEKSLVLAEDGPNGARWYRLLETIRQFALQRLRATGEEPSLRERHFHWYVELAEQFEGITRWTRGVPWRSRRPWLARVAWEYPNLRAAWQWALAGDSGRVAAGLRLAAALYPFFYSTGYLSDAGEWFATLLARDRHGPPTRARARALSVAAKLAVHHGRDGDARALGLEYLALPETLHEPPVKALVLNALSVVALHEGDVGRAREYVTTAIGLARMAPEYGVSLYLPYLAAIAEAMGQLEEAEAIYQTALAEARADDFPMTYGLALCGLARIAHGRADHARARALYEEGLSELLEVGGMPQVALTHAALGWLALEEGDAQRARGCFAQSLELATRLGHHEALVAALEGVAALLARGRSGRDALPRQAEQSLTLRLLGAAQRLRAQGHLPAAGQPVGRVLAAATRSAGEPRARRLLAEGGALAPDEAGRLARSALESCERSRLEPALTPREHEVAVLLARGCSNREIAQALVVGLRTAEMHVGNLLGKLGLSSRSQIAAWAVQHGLLDTVP